MTNIIPQRTRACLWKELIQISSTVAVTVVTVATYSTDSQ